MAQFLASRGYLVIEPEYRGSAGYGDEQLREDVRVPVAHGERLRDALEKAGHPPEWVVYPKEGHGWQRLADRLDWAQRVETFLGKHLRDEEPR